MNLPDQVSPEPAGQGLGAAGAIRQHGVGELQDGDLLGYAQWFETLKQRVRDTQLRAARAANTEVLRLYWSVGHDILIRQDRDGWGAGVVDRVSRDLHREFPDQRGWSVTNLRYMRRVATIWQN